VVSGSAGAGGWSARRDDCAPGTRRSRREYEGEHALSKRLDRLNCAALAAHAEGYRLAINAQTPAVSNKPQARVRARADDQRRGCNQRSCLTPSRAAASSRILRTLGT
jgi:hypothetical protein